MRQSLAAIAELEKLVTTSTDVEGIVLRYGQFYGPGSTAWLDAVSRRKLPVVGSGLMVLMASALYGIFLLLTLYMQLVLGWTPLHTGVAYVVFGAATLTGIGIASQLLPKVGVRPILVRGMTLAAGGLALFTRIGLEPDYWAQIVPAMVLLAVGAGLAFVSITVAAVSEANEADAGLASGMVTTAQQVGGALGLAVLVSIATTRASNLLSSGHPSAMAQLSGSHLAFAVGRPGSWPSVRSWRRPSSAATSRPPCPRQPPSPK